MQSRSGLLTPLPSGVGDRSARGHLHYAGCLQGQDRGRASGAKGEDLVLIRNALRNALDRAFRSGGHAAVVHLRAGRQRWWIGSRKPPTYSCAHVLKIRRDSTLPACSKHKVAFASGRTSATLATLFEIRRVFRRLITAPGTCIHNARLNPGQSGRNACSKN